MPLKIRFFFKRLLKSALWIFLFSWWDRLARPAAALQKQDAAVLVKLDAIGDFILCCPVMRRLADIEIAQGRECVLLCNRICADLAQRMFPDCRIIPVQITKLASSLSYRHEIIRALPVRVSGAFNIAVSHDLIFSDAIIRATRAGMRWALRGNPDRNGPVNQALAHRFYTDLVTVPDAPEFDAEHIRAGLALAGYDMTAVLHPLPAMADSIACELPDEPYFVISPGAQKALRQWPAENFAELANAVAEKTGWLCVLCGTQADVAAGAVIAARFKGRLDNRIGKTRLTESLALIRHSRLILANDSAPTHIAAACGVPCAVAQGGGHATSRFLPYPPDYTLGRPPAVASHPMPCTGCNWHCVYPIGTNKSAPCLTGVSVADMWNAVQELNLLSR